MNYERVGREIGRVVGSLAAAAAGGFITYEIYRAGMHFGDLQSSFYNELKSFLAGAIPAGGFGMYYGAKAGEKIVRFNRTSIDCKCEDIKDEKK